MKATTWNPLRRIRDFMDGEASGGLALMGAAMLALVVANSPLAPLYFNAFATQLGPLSTLHWINDGLMAIFFLLVGLEIKREALDGELATWSQRALPGIGAFGGMLVPALIYVAFNRGDAEAVRGWAIPTATDIAFALGVLSLLGNRVPVSLKVFLAALAIIDDLGAVLIIALFYTNELSLPHLGGCAIALVALAAFNMFRVAMLWPYLAVGALLWVLVLGSGVHATLAGVALAFAIPLNDRDRAAHSAVLAGSPLLRLEHALHRVVPFLIIPLFGFANAGVSFAGFDIGVLAAPLTLGIALGLALGKLIGVFGFATLAIKAGFARLPEGASWGQLLGVALICGIGFTMSLFIGLLAFDGNVALQDEVKVGILGGSLLAGIAGALVLRFANGVRSGA